MCLSLLLCHLLADHFDLINLGDLFIIWPHICLLRFQCWTFPTVLGMNEIWPFWGSFVRNWFDVIQLNRYPILASFVSFRLLRTTRLWLAWVDSNIMELNLANLNPLFRSHFFRSVISSGQYKCTRWPKAFKSFPFIFFFVCGLHSNLINLTFSLDLTWFFYYLRFDGLKHSLLIFFLYLPPFLQLSLADVFQEFVSGFLCLFLFRGRRISLITYHHDPDQFSCFDCADVCLIVSVFFFFDSFLLLQDDTFVSLHDENYFNFSIHYRRLIDFNNTFC